MAETTNEAALRAELAEARRKCQTFEVTALLERKHGFDSDIAPLLSRGEDAQARLRAGESPEHVAAAIAAEAPAKFRAKKPTVDGVALRERYERLHAEAAERRGDAVAELRRKLGTTR
jgi:hypothetical protein